MPPFSEHGFRSKVLEQSLIAQRSSSIQIIHLDDLHSIEMADRFKPLSMDWTKCTKGIKGIPNVMEIADNNVVCGSSEQQQDKAFTEMLKATGKHNVSLNSEKLQFKQSQVDFYGQILTEKGIKLAKEKLEAIHNIKAPSNIKELQTILGMVTYLTRYSSKLADLTSPLRS